MSDIKPIDNKDPKIPQVPPNIVQHIWCSASITKKMEDVFIGFICSQAQQGKDISEYVVYLTTVGGNPFSAISLYNFLKSLPQKTTVYNMGTVYSAGVLFFLGFQNRRGVPDCSFMIHQTMLPKTSLPEWFNIFDLNTKEEELRAMDENTYRIIEKETSQQAASPLHLDDIEKAALKTTIYHAEEAVQRGFINKIEQPVIPTSQIIYITDQYLATLPG
jgi:ATP-dependent protease ClpP protease subunit